MDAALAEYESARSDVAEFESKFNSDEGPTESLNEDVHFGARALAWFSMDDLENNKWLENQIQSDQIGNTDGKSESVPGHFGNGIKLSGDEACEFPYLETALDPWERFTISFWIYLPEEVNEGVVLHQSGGQDVGYFGTELTLHGGKLRWAMLRFWPGNALAIETTDAVPKKKWVHIAVSNSGEGSAGGLKISVDGVSATNVLRDNLTKRPDPPARGFNVGARLQSTGIPNAVIDDLIFFDRPLSPVELSLVMSDQRSAPRDQFAEQELREHDLMNDYRYEFLEQRVATCYKSLLDARTDVVEVPIMRETADEQPAWVLARGSYDAPRGDDNRAERHTPSALPPMPDGFEQNRLGLARWLTTPNHPLTARVAVNRLWQNFFGSGLVPTLNDFGIQGQQPSHPELLDWLARDFVNSGWDVKRLCKQIALGSTYCQESSVPESVRENDPQNTLLARGPERRLSAEMIRDQVLFVAGILDEKVGGPPVSPYQPENLWSEGNSMTPAYKQSVGLDFYRRSLYTIWKRSTPMPNMVLFDVGEPGSLFDATPENQYATAGPGIAERYPVCRSRPCQPNGRWRKSRQVEWPSNRCLWA